MPKINVLPREIAELIAAGEVVERPASIVKETIENSIDAGAKHITVEIQRGGITFIRITDDGCGIAHGDVPLAFLRHATSKIKMADDLYSISTLGFRGEALAAAAAVSRTELFTKTSDEQFGTHYMIEGGTETLYEESGCPDGTTLIIRDIFYNTPARMKFLKKDVSEGNAVAAVVDRAALSHPEIAFKLIRDGKQTLSTSGDGKLESAVYSVLGRDYQKSLIPVSGGNEMVNVTGFTCKPVFCRQSRAGQFVFLNGRLVHSGTVTAAAEQAYRNSAMVGKFPAFVLNVALPFEAVDVNVHPAKTEIRFADEKKVFEAVHYAVKNALTTGDTRPSIGITEPVRKPAFERMTTEQYRAQQVNIPETPVERAYRGVTEKKHRFASDNKPFFMRDDVKNYIASKEEKEPVKKVNIDIEKVLDDEPVKAVTENPEIKEKPGLKEEPPKEETSVIPAPEEQEIPIRYVGEAFLTYIVVEKGESLFLIDKHAAHERIIFNRLKRSEIPQTQALLCPVTVRLGADEYDAVISNTELLYKAGFEVDDFGNFTVAVRAMPASLTAEDVESVMTEAAASLKIRGSVQIEELDRIYHTVACKAAIKAGNITTPTELLQLAKRVLSDSDVMYCPHGRPVAFEIKRRDLEKQFGRIQ